VPRPALQRNRQNARHVRTRPEEVEGAHSAPGAGRGAEAKVRDIDEVTRKPTSDGVVRSRYLAEGCPCQDARIVSHRRARFYAHLARLNGETARRIVPPEPDWELPHSA
jgi:hypothetical protein